MRHSLGGEICAGPVMVVPSMNEPSAFAVNVPVTLKFPVICPVGQVKPNCFCASTVPDTATHDDATVQVPVTLPPQAVTPAGVQVPEAPPAALPPMLPSAPPDPLLADAPPLPVAPPLLGLPPEPEGRAASGRADANAYG
jgi:hypothetical protein